MSVRQLAGWAFRVFVMLSAFGASLDIMWSLGIRDEVLLGATACLVFYAAWRLTEG